MSKPTPSPTSALPRMAAQAAIVALALACLAWRAWPDGRLRVIFLETKGDAALIQTPSGGYLLIDGGADPAALAAAVGRQLPFWRRSLDAVVLTQTDQAHLAGQVAALARYRAGVAIAPPIVRRGALIDQWRKLLAAEQTPIHAARAGERFAFGELRLRVLATGDGDAAGMVLRIDYRATSVVLDHSGGGADEAALADRPARPVDLLAFAWERDPHTPIVAALRPRALVLTDGQPAEQPAEQTFVERAVGGARLYHERLDGTITWVSDGARAWVETERPRG